MKKITLLLSLLFFNTITAQYFTEGFEGGTTVPPAGWTHNQTNTNETWTIGTIANSGTNSAQVVYDSALGVQDEQLVSPSINLTAATAPQLTFFVNMSYYWSIDPNNNYDAKVYANVGSGNVLIWEEADLGAFTSFTWIEVNVDLSAYAGNNITLTFAYEGTDGASLNIDDITVEESATCLDPTVTFDDFTQTTVDISMDTSADYEIEWGVYPYTQGSGGSTASITASDTYQLTGLMSGVSYNVFVRKNCGGLDGSSNYVEVTTGTSPSNLGTFPYSEDLEPDANQALLLNFGVSFFTNTNNWSFGQDNTTDGDTTNDFANDGISYLYSNNTFSDAAADAWIYIGPFNLTAGNQYDFSFMQRNFETASATRPAKDLEVVAATTDDGTTDTVLLTLSDMNNTSYLQRTASFTPTTSGDYYFGIHDNTDLLTGVTQANSVIIDSFSMSETLSIEEFESNNFTYYYNKNSKTLNLELAYSTFSNIEIYNLTGQLVIAKDLSETSETISLSSLNTGVYLAKIMTEDNSKNIKFIVN